MSPHMPRPESFLAGVSGIPEYREAVSRADLAGAARRWQEAIRSPLAADFQKEFDFSLVQEYSLAWQTGDLQLLQKIGKKAVVHPDHRLSQLLAQVVEAPAEAHADQGGAHPEAADAVPAEAADAVPAGVLSRGRDFLKGLVEASRQGGDVRKFAKKFRTEKAVETVVAKVKTVEAEVKKTTESKKPGKPEAYQKINQKSNQKSKDQVAQDPSASSPSQHPTLKHLIDFLNQAAIRNRISFTDLEIETLRNHQDLEIPSVLGNQDFDCWARQQNLKLSAKSLKQLYRASLLLANRMTATEASSLAMAARSAQTKKKAPNPPPENPPS